MNKECIMSLLLALCHLSRHNDTCLSSHLSRHYVTRLGIMSLGGMSLVSARRYVTRLCKALCLGGGYIIHLYGGSCHLSSWSIMLLISEVGCIARLSGCCHLSQQGVMSLVSAGVMYLTLAM